MGHDVEPYKYSDWALIFVLIISLMEGAAPNPTFGTTIAITAFIVACRLGMYINERFLSWRHWWSYVVYGLILTVTIKAMMGLLILYYLFLAPRH